MSRNLEATKPVHALRTLADALLRDAAECGTRYQASNRVYIGSIPGLDLGDAECATQLDALRTAGLVRFERCDMTQWADADLLEQSEYLPAGTPATFHFVVIA